MPDTVYPNITIRTHCFSENLRERDGLFFYVWFLFLAIEVGAQVSELLEVQLRGFFLFFCTRRGDEHNIHVFLS